MNARYTLVDLAGALGWAEDDHDAFEGALDAYRAEVLGDAAALIETEQHRRDDEIAEQLGALPRIAEAEHIAVHRAAGQIRRMAEGGGS